MVGGCCCSAAWIWPRAGWPVRRMLGRAAGWRIADARSRALHGASPGAERADAVVWFHSSAEAWMLLLRALASGNVPAAWFWRLAVPGWNGAPLNVWLPEVMREAARDPEVLVRAAHCARAGDRGRGVGANPGGAGGHVGADAAGGRGGWPRRRGSNRDRGRHGAAFEGAAGARRVGFDRRSDAFRGGRACRACVARAAGADGACAGAGRGTRWSWRGAMPFMGLPADLSMSRPADPVPLAKDLAASANKQGISRTSMPQRTSANSDEPAAHDIRARDNDMAEAACSRDTGPGRAAARDRGRTG